MCSCSSWITPILLVVEWQLLHPRVQNHAAHSISLFSSNTTAILPSALEKVIHEAQIFVLKPARCLYHISLCSWSAWLWWYSVQTVTGTTGGYQELEHLKSLWQWQYGWGQLHGIGPFRDNKWLSTHMHSRWGPRVGLVMQPLLESPLTHPTGSLRVRARAREWNYFFFFFSLQRLWSGVTFLIPMDCYQYQLVLPR